MSEKSLNKLIVERRATPPRFMLEKEIPEEHVMRLLENANWAPSHKKAEPWRFKVYRGQAKQDIAEVIHSQLMERIASGESINPEKANKLKANIERVPVVIQVAMQRDPAKRIPEWEEIAAVAMAVQNMWLTAADLELGAFWSTPSYLPLLNDVAGLNPGQKLMGFFFVGYVAVDYPSPGRGAVDPKVEWAE